MSFYYDFINKLLADLLQVEDDLVLLAVIVIACLIVIDAFVSVAARRGKEVGLRKGSAAISIDGGKVIHVREYISESQQLAGKPDAVFLEDGHIIPVERKPFAKKIRDRYVAQLLVYMRLIEEFEGKKPPYGYLVLGPKCKQVKIYNTEERQNWLSEILTNMHKVLDGTAAMPTPSQKKCAQCEVRGSCRFAPSGLQRLA